MRKESSYRFSMAELLAITTILAIGVAWPVMLPMVLTMIFVRFGLGLFQGILAAVAVCAAALYFLT
jgi:hypothetical protein